MEILINNNQAKKIILESTGGKFNDKIKELYNQVSEVLEISGEQIGENLKFLVTWGASIGGIIGPLNDFIRDKYIGLNDIEISLLLTGIIANYYFDNKKLIKKIIKKMKEMGLIPVFSQIFEKAEELKKVFFEFIESLAITTHKLSNILSYAFIIPIIPSLYSAVSSGHFTESDVSEIVERILGFGLITVSGVALRNLMLRIVKRFKTK